MNPNQTLNVGRLGSKQTVGGSP